MLFNSLEFVVFLPIVFSLYWVFGHRNQNRLLVVASYVFYGWWDVRFLSLIAISTAVDYTIGRRLGRTTDERARKALLITSVAVNLGILGYFKYAGFFVESFSDMMHGFGFDTSSPVIDIILPVGISFYTFQTISYSFDVYRRRIEPETSIMAFAAYVAYFPQLVAGPIERAAHLLPQIRSERSFPTFDQFRSGFALIILGFFKKIVLADGLAGIVDARFTNPDEFGAVGLIVGVYAFAIQIYGDFSGYSSIARGVSRLFGIDLMRNFEQPYLSTSITQFWRTWHISLSSWLHDYLYVPLGGNRDGRVRTYVNLMITMVLGGLWHGAAWTFVVWGTLHGAFLAIHRALGAYEPRGRPAPPHLSDVWKIVVTFNVVGFAWIFFRADSAAIALDIVERIFSWAPGAVDARSLQLVTAAALSMLVIDLVDRRREEWQPLERWHPAFAGAALGLALVGIVIFGGGTSTPFIYFQF